MQRKDLTDQQFGHLTAIKPDGKSTDGHTAWLCKCDCGKMTRVAINKLTGGHTTSCGHVKADRSHSIGPGYEAKRVNGVATFLLDSNRKVRSDNKTGVTGVKIVHYRDGSEHFQAAITVEGKRKTLGTFTTMEAAKKARLKEQTKYEK